MVSDTFNARVLVWNDFPTENSTPAEVVLGQSNFKNSVQDDGDQDDHKDANPTARTFDRAAAGLLYRDRMIVMDRFNHRVLIFEAN